MESGTLEARDGARIHWTARGGAGEPVVVPGAWMLASHLDAVAGERPILFYDMRSRGRSARIDDPEELGFDRDVRDLEVVRRHTGEERITVVGFSYLGGVAARWAMRHPERVRRLVLLGSVPPRSPAGYTEAAPDPAEFVDPEAMRRLEELRAAGTDDSDPAAYCRQYWRTMLPAYTAGPEAAERLAGELDLGCDLPNERPAEFGRVLGHVMADLETYDWREEARALDAPALVVHGEEDHVAPFGGAREWAELLPDSALETVPDAGHLLWAERPARVRGAIRGFLARGG
jgi:proline iminopeptidase